jgi:hypothetical protein
VITSNLVFCASDPDKFTFAIISSSMYMAWMSAIGGRLKSDPRFSKTFNYNAFPLPDPTAAARVSIIEAGRTIAEVRRQTPGIPLAKLYTSGHMPPALADAHEKLDQLVDDLFHCTDRTHLGRQRRLLRMYRNATKPSPLTAD